MRVVGITGNYFLPLRTGAPSPKGAYYLCAEYWHALLSEPVLPWYMPYTQNDTLLKEYSNRLDALVLTGGFDIPSQFYGGDPSLDSLCTLDLPRVEMELKLLSLVWGRIPILGICLGMQIVNVFCGGSIWQDLPTQCPGSRNHSLSNKVPDLLAHAVSLVENTRLLGVMQKPKFMVNSSHHQAVRTVGKGLLINALSEDQIIEGIETPDGSFLGVQWHPESLDAVEQKRLFAWIAGR